MSIHQLMALNALLTACFYAGRFLLGVGSDVGQWSGPVGPTKTRQAACVYPAGFSLPWYIGGVQQTGPPKNRAGRIKDLLPTRLRPQRDLFGTPFGPPFLIQTNAKYAKTPDFRPICFAVPKYIYKKVSRGRGAVAAGGNGALSLGFGECKKLLTGNTYSSIDK